MAGNVARRATDTLYCAANRRVRVDLYQVAQGRVSLEDGAGRWALTIGVQRARRARWRGRVRGGWLE